MNAVTRREVLALRLPAPEVRGDSWLRLHRAAMACRFEVTLSSEDGRHLPAAREALDEADRIEDLLTVFRDGSALVRLNRLATRESIEVDPELFDLLRTCREICLETEGAFDVTTTPLSRCWGFLRRQGRVPDASEIESARACVGMERVDLDPQRRTVRLQPSMELNLGSIGKGHALARMGAVLHRRGVSDALVSAGGSSVLALGGRAEGWPIDLRPRRLDPARRLRVRLREGAMATSGAGEQFVDVEGRRYGHVLDPRTGWPASTALSATVMCADAARADALSTAFLVGGVDLARRYCTSHPGVLALVTPEGSGRPEILGAYAGASLEAA